MNSLENLILVGVIKSCHGIKGHVMLKSFTDPATKILERNLVNESGANIYIKLISQNAKGELICTFNDIATRNEAEHLKGYKIFCLRASLPELEEDEFYIADLTHLPVLNQDHKEIGKIKNILNFGAGDIIEIEFSDQTTELLPFNKEFFPIITKDYVILNYQREA
ncbi:ribosome maturation factor RimM [Rickettsia rickettsii]|uniref:Ribosome maturation factor RimM n=1 Tax=Rickettsia rickettsii (strain Iowa) TaxID=452659 RepID=RIMM_RICRO|nr:ribosome maturation factor RimM [Rickettsia rickettsii]B0BX63.1 RecName: Full=Ribosome maturation factor RimM [Rickettsia rickettsii str. Iowa]ABY72439.1 16S rRNA processing protein [Rickettsia rickettsii str. Iowa]AFB24774.1 16S rRNA-processing protein RimM [Rickettsia rickettsii str. Arizona]AFB27459.1 16S rRNA-processing protein RimM [Rickettsia rickettsii str. Hino]AFB30116.1 16S rRNA-processing protein RimM [Rickettsia rickettsii str. Hauke]AJG34275.1 16S rRNA-processing protein RimM 